MTEASREDACEHVLLAVVCSAEEKEYSRRHTVSYVNTVHMHSTSRSTTVNYYYVVVCTT